MENMYTAEQIDAFTQEWLKKRITDLDLFDVLSENLDGLLSLSLESLRDEELKKSEQDESWD